VDLSAPQRDTADRVRFRGHHWYLVTDIESTQFGLLHFYHCTRQRVNMIRDQLVKACFLETFDRNVHQFLGAFLVRWPTGFPGLKVLYDHISDRISKGQSVEWEHVVPLGHLAGSSYVTTSGDEGGSRVHDGVEPRTKKEDEHPVWFQEFYDHHVVHGPPGDDTPLGSNTKQNISQPGNLPDGVTIKTPPTGYWVVLQPQQNGWNVLIAIIILAVVFLVVLGVIVWIAATRLGGGGNRYHRLGVDYERLGNARYTEGDYERLGNAHYTEDLRMNTLGSYKYHRPRRSPLDNGRRGVYNKQRDVYNDSH